MKLLYSLALLLFLPIAATQAQYIEGQPIADIGKKLEIVRYSPDGNLIAGVISGDELKIWIANTPTYKPDIDTEHKEIYDVEFTADSKHIITAGKDGKVVMWEVESGKKVKTFKGHRDKVYAIDITLDGSQLATASEDRMVKLWDIESGKETNTFFTHNAPVLDVAISDDGKLLASIGEDKKVYTRELPLGKQLENGVLPLSNAPTKIIFGANNHTLFVASGKGSIQSVNYDDEHGAVSVLGTGKDDHKDEITDFAMSPDGKFLASADGDQFIVWNLEKNIKQNKTEVSGNLTSLDFDPNGKWLYTTGKNANIWDISRWNIIPRIQYRNSLDQTAPQLFVDSPRMRGEVKTITGSEITVAGKIFDETGLHSVEINGNKVELSSDGSFSMKLQLSFGANVVKIRAKDINNNVALKEFTVVREAQSENELIFDIVESTNHLLIIGADKYENWPQLSNAVSDAKKVKEVLQEKYGFSADYTTTLFNDQVTRGQIYDAFKKLINQVKPNDNVLIYYSGHGAFDKSVEEGFWVPVDAHQGQFGDYFSNEELIKRIGAIKSKHTFLVVDACYSGSLFLESTRGSGYIDKVGSIKSRWGLASGRLEEVADGATGEMSPFCKRFTEFLDNNSAKRFTVSELVQYVKRNVTDDTGGQAPQGNPLRNVGDEGGEFVFTLEGATEEADEGN